MRDKALNEGEIRAKLAQAEVHFSHYRWDDAITTFEAILAGHPDHPAAAQGWANAVEQKSIDEELSQTLAKVRATLAERRFDEALSLLNHAQTRGALSHILKYHSEIDGLRSEAQEGQEWQRRIDAATREADALASRGRFDQAVDVLDNALRPLQARGWDRLGESLAAFREKLLTERDVSERIQFAQAAYERQDYGLAAVLAAPLREELPGREDVRRLHERASASWARLQERLAAVNDALAEARTDDALALLAALRSEHPRNADWQAIALRVRMDQGRVEMAKGRSAMVEQAFEDAVEAFEAAQGAFDATVEIFQEHPTAEQERREAGALREAALFADQAARDQAAYRWAAARQGWKVSREHLSQAIAARGRDFGEVAAVIDALLSEAEAALDDLEQARLMLADGRQALDGRDAGSAREAFRAGLARVEGVRAAAGADLQDLRERLGAGLREAERVQRDVKKLLSQAEAAGEREEQRLSFLLKAYERWETAPGLAARLAEALLVAAAASRHAGDEDGALGYCDQVGEVTGAPAGALAEAARMSDEIQARRAAKAALAEAAALVGQAALDPIPAPEPFRRALAILDDIDWQAAGSADIGPAAEELREQAADAHERTVAARSGITESEALADAGEWRGAAEALAGARAALGPLGGAELGDRVEELREYADAVGKARTQAIDALNDAEALVGFAADGDLASVDWDAAERALAEARKAFRAVRLLPRAKPKGWDGLQARVERLDRRVKLLKRVHEQISAGQGVEALPALRAAAASDADPLVLAVLERLMDSHSGDAANAAAMWLGKAAGALERGELATAEAYLGLAQSYASAAPQLMPEVRRMERQVEVLGQVREATRQGRAHAAAGDLKGALAQYRRALELATDGEAGLPANARREINRLLDLEGTREEAGTAAALDASPANPLVSEFVAPAVAHWWRLTQRTAALAGVETRMALGRATEAADAAASLASAVPGDPQILELHRAASARAAERQLGRGRRRLQRARRLAEQGAYAEALVEIETRMLPDTRADAASEGLESSEAEELADEAAELGRSLRKLLELNEKLGPLVEEMRRHGLTGEYDEALTVRERAEFLDPRRVAKAVWEELDGLAGLIEKRRAAAIPAPRRAAQEESTSVFLPHPTPEVLPPPPLRSAQAGGSPAVPASDAAEDVDLRRAVTHRPAEQGPAEAAGTAEDLAEAYPPGEQPAEAAEVRAMAVSEPAELYIPLEPAAPFDLQDWLSNVTEVGPEDAGTGDRS